MYNILILLFIIIGAALGFKRGFIKETISFIGIFLVLILAFVFKNQLSILMYSNLPFFKFGNILKGVTVLNIALYEILAFVALLLLFGLLFKIVTAITSIADKLIKMTIILIIPSKLLGAVVGALKSLVYAFIILFVLSLPVFDIPELTESSNRNMILNDTPILSNYTKDVDNILNEFMVLKDNYEDDSDANEFNSQTLDLYLKYDVISVESVEMLIEKDKLNIENVDEILNKYKEEK